MSVPVFAQAPLVRNFPWLSLGFTLVWVALGYYLQTRDEGKLWGDLLVGFSWSWLAGSIYWGWWRNEPLIHLPIEAIGLPFALWGIRRGRGPIGNWFYLGSLIGTAITDLYFYIVDLIPYWRQIMTVDPALVGPILQQAVHQVQTPWGISWAVVLANGLLGIAIAMGQRGKAHHWAFTGAVLFTIFVDGLFWLAAAFA